MTITTTGTIPDELVASVQHLELLGESISRVEERLARLKAARAQTLSQIAATTKRISRERNWGSADMLALYESLNGPGFFSAWKAAGLPHPQRMKHDVETAGRHRPNDPVSGGWIGDWVVTQETWGPVGRIENGTYPRRGTPVVYVLYDADASPVYCGSSEQFDKRLWAHYRDGKRFVAWRAVPCADREQAYVLEDRLLKQSCPPLNRKASR
jgi:hypothetical protein